MNSDRIKEIQQETAYPESTSVQQALLKVWNEVEQGLNAKNLSPGCCMGCNHWRHTNSGKGECLNLKVYTDEAFYCSDFNKGT